MKKTKKDILEQQAESKWQEFLKPFKNFINNLEKQRNRDRELNELESTIVGETDLQALSNNKDKYKPLGLTTKELLGPEYESTDDAIADLGPKMSQETQKSKKRGDGSYSTYSNGQFLNSISVYQAPDEKVRLSHLYQNTIGKRAKAAQTLAHLMALEIEGAIWSPEDQVHKLMDTGIIGESLPVKTNLDSIQGILSTLRVPPTRDESEESIAQKAEKAAENIIKGLTSVLEAQRNASVTIMKYQVPRAIEANDAYYSEKKENLGPKIIEPKND